MRAQSDRLSGVVWNNVLNTGTYKMAKCKKNVKMAAKFSHLFANISPMIGFSSDLQLNAWNFSNIIIKVKTTVWAFTMPSSKYHANMPIAITVNMSE